MRPTNSENKLGLDYIAESARFDASLRLIDVHTHVTGREAAKIYRAVADAYGVELTYSMTPLDQIETVREVLGDRIRFIAIPRFESDDRRRSFGSGYLEDVERFYEKGARIVKFWCAPRGRDIGREAGQPNLLCLDSPNLVDVMKLGQSLGMYFMTHVSDPDTWFATRYKDASLYGTKRDQYVALESMLDRFEVPWIAAHMGGWPEDLEFLSGLLERHSNLFLDTSATKWMVRELSKHSPEDLRSFLERWRGRILFGSDIVTNDRHLASEGGADYALDLYASRYFALRSLFETDYDGESPIVDPDLAMVDPGRYGPNASPLLRGKSLPADLLRDLYHGSAQRLLGRLK